MFARSWRCFDFVFCSVIFVRMTKKVFAEVGIGNETFLSTEYEEGELEYRVPTFAVPVTIQEFYIRIWVGEVVIVLSTKEGIKQRRKNRKAFKVLLGIGGIDE